jgi:hypothetical protein
MVVATIGNRCLCVLGLWTLGKLLQARPWHEDGTLPLFRASSADAAPFSKDLACTIPLHAEGLNVQSPTRRTAFDMVAILFEEAGKRGWDS